MKNYTVKRYESKYFSDWNAFISTAKNATFLFNRDFMEYHSDRFEDFSLMIFQEDKLVCVLPANRVGATIYSHQGLTYGGLVFQTNIKLAYSIAIFRDILIYLNENQIDKLNLKLIPSIYCNGFSEEIEYSLFLLKAQLIRRDCLSVINLLNLISFSKIRIRGVKKGSINNLIIKEVNDFEEFWTKILIPNLEFKHNVKPAHNLDEISKLKKIFPKNIRQFNVYYKDEIIAGTTIFESQNVAHAQYISGNESKLINGSLDYLYDNLIKVVYKDKKFIDFGISNEDQGKRLNNGLSYWKESFGASIVVHDYYEVETLNYIKLDNVII